MLKMNQMNTHWNKELLQTEEIEGKSAIVPIIELLGSTAKVFLGQETQNHTLVRGRAV